MDINDQVDDIPEVPALPQVEEGQEDSTDYKALAQQQQDALTKMQGITKRFQTKLKKLSETPKPEVKPAIVEKKGFDYAEKAYLKSSGIEALDFEFVKEVMDATGKDIDGVLGSKHFQAELKERKDVRMSEAATPSGSKGAGNTTRDQVEYWIAKGELPPANQQELRRKVVNAKIAAQKQSHFAPQAVTGNPG